MCLMWVQICVKANIESYALGVKLMSTDDDLKSFEISIFFMYSMMEDLHMQLDVLLTSFTRIDAVAITAFCRSNGRKQ